MRLKIGPGLRQVKLGLPGSPITVADRGGNTSVTDHGDNSYTIEKISGGGLYNASAVSVQPWAGDFAIQLARTTTVDNFAFGATSDPEADNDYTSIDFAMVWDLANSAYYIRENGVYTGIGGFTDTGGFGFVWRTGTTIGYGVGASLATAQAAPQRTVAGVTGALYFDSSFLGVGTIVELALSGDV